MKKQVLKPFHSAQDSPVSCLTRNRPRHHAAAASQLRENESQLKT
jgi:hypothetical protein